jgi:hypothetical protein
LKIKTKQTYKTSELENKRKPREYDSNKRFGESKNRYFTKPFIEKTRSAWFT